MNKYLNSLSSRISEVNISVNSNSHSQLILLYQSAHRLFDRIVNLEIAVEKEDMFSANRIIDDCLQTAQFFKLQKIHLHFKELKKLVAARGVKKEKSSTFDEIKGIQSILDSLFYEVKLLLKNVLPKIEF